MENSKIYFKSDKVFEIVEKDIVADMQSVV